MLTAKDFIKDLEHAKHFVHTGRLESYLSPQCTTKYMSKPIHLKYNGMLYLRSILAVLDHNYNTDKNIIGDKMVFSKSL
ncbi:THAP domain-containing protein 2 [Aphis craccivora]|uniref:THAP domain-containing protein 2 n=1 Tax=Aphis craccivora TaxID=307492 RepID=A0A6G0ZML1_APHCR|nr:THAP domain-containing protein 2 [Aphis craccivora]